MLGPSKFVPLDKSSLGQAAVLLANLSHDVSLSELFIETHEYFEDIVQFIYALDVLFVLGKIKVDFQTGIVSHVN